MKTKKRTLIAAFLALALLLLIFSIFSFLFFSASTDRPPPSTRLPHVIEQEIDRLNWGNIAFNSPEFVGYGETTVVQLLLSESKTGKQLISLIDERGNKETYRIQFSNDMDARLAGKAFDVSPITPEHQAVSGSGVAEWKWEIRAKELGEQRIFLTLNAHLSANGQHFHHTVKTFSKNLNVKVAWPQSMVFFLFSYWQWICTAIAIPLIGWIASHLVHDKGPTSASNRRPRLRRGRGRG
ncbi:hypothetical protein [Xanthomonas bundabergensis]|uniref:hypothetical protein n=1 Tax=Xanthomonas bundabergensis TaxID=3160842 RepID=UPI0035158E34